LQFDLFATKQGLPILIAYC